MIRPGAIVAGAVVVVAVGMALIPIQRPARDFSRDDSVASNQPSIAEAPSASLSAVRSAAGHSTAASVRDTRWDELIPENWDPSKAIRALQEGVQFIRDSDPRAIERLKKIRDVWNDTPTNKGLDGVAVRIPAT